MRIHANQIIESVKSGVFNILSGKKPDDLIYTLNDCICFYAGKVEEFSTIKIIPEIVRLPYQKIYVEFDSGENDINGVEVGPISFICKEEAECLKIMIIRSFAKKWVYMNTLKLGSSDLCQSKDYIKVKWLHYPFDSNQEKILISSVRCLLKFLSALNCTNIIRVEHKPSDQLQKARTKRGKKPLFSFWTLEIDIPRSESMGIDYGGTHASPRVHLRRGHFREYKPGVYCWVQAHAVGNKSLGMIHKDYKSKVLVMSNKG